MKVFYVYITKPTNSIQWHYTLRLPNQSHFLHLLHPHLNLLLFERFSVYIIKATNDTQWQYALYLLNHSRFLRYFESTQWQYAPPSLNHSRFLRYSTSTFKSVPITAPPYSHPPLHELISPSTPSLSCHLTKYSLWITAFSHCNIATTRLYPSTNRNISTVWDLTQFKSFLITNERA